MNEATQQHASYAAFMSLLGARDAADKAHKLALLDMREAELRGDSGSMLDSYVAIVMSRYSVYVELDEMVRSHLIGVGRSVQNGTLPRDIKRL